MNVGKHNTNAAHLYIVHTTWMNPNKGTKEGTKLKEGLETLIRHREASVQPQITRNTLSVVNSRNTS